MFEFPFKREVKRDNKEKKERRNKIVFTLSAVLNRVLKPTKILLPLQPHYTLRFRTHCHHIIPAIAYSRVHASSSAYYSLRSPVHYNENPVNFVRLARIELWSLLESYLYLQWLTKGFVCTSSTAHFKRLLLSYDASLGILIDEHVYYTKPNVTIKLARKKVIQFPQVEDVPIKIWWNPKVYWKWIF